LDVPRLERPFQFIAIGKYDYEITRHHRASPPMVRQANYLNAAELRVPRARRIEPLICVQIEAAFSQNLELNRLL
jgi:hypothetical protein